MSLTMKGNHEFLDLGLILKPGESEHYSFDLEEYFYLPLEKGDYRIADGYLISNTFKIE